MYIYKICIYKYICIYIYIIFHQPRFPWKKRISLLNHHFFRTLFPHCSGQKQGPDCQADRKTTGDQPHLAATPFVGPTRSQNLFVVFQVQQPMKHLQRPGFTWLYRSWSFELHSLYTSIEEWQRMRHYPPTFTQPFRTGKCDDSNNLCFAKPFANPPRTEHPKVERSHLPWGNQRCEFTRRTSVKITLQKTCSRQLPYQAL